MMKTTNQTLRRFLQYSITPILLLLCAFLAGATPTPTPTPYATNIVDVNVFKSGTNEAIKLRVLDNGDDTYTPIVSSSGGGGGGDASAANQTAVQANPGSDATKATAVQGVTGGKPMFVTQTGAQITIVITNETTDGTVAAGKRHIEFILSSDFAGTIGGVTIDPAVLVIYNPGEVPVGSTFAALSYTISAGNATITTW